MREIYPLVPLFGSQSVSVAVVRYGGALYVGVTSSWPEREMVESFTNHLHAAFAELARTPVPESMPVVEPQSAPAFELAPPT